MGEQLRLQMGDALAGDVVTLNPPVIDDNYIEQHTTSMKPNLSLIPERVESKEESNHQL